MKRGFTLIELLVTMAVSMLIAVVLMASFSRVRIDMNQSLFRVVDVLRQAQAQALAGTLTPGGVYPCGYGVHLTATTYTLYAAPAPTAAGCGGVSTQYAGSTVITTTALSNPVIQFNPITSTDIFFQPPLAKLFVDGVAPGGNSTITLKRTDNNDTRIITISSNGLIQ